MGKEEPTHHNNQFTYHRYHNASRSPDDRHHNKRRKHPGLDPLQPDMTSLVRFAVSWPSFDRELPCRLVAAKYGQPSSNPPSKIDTRLAVSCDASPIFCQWPTKSHHYSSKPSLPPRLRSDGGYARHLASSLANDLTHVRCHSPASTSTEKAMLGTPTIPRHCLRALSMGEKVGHDNGPRPCLKYFIPLKSMAITLHQARRGAL